MKLFIWADPYTVSYGSTMVIAVAKNVKEARKIAEGAPSYSYVKYRERSRGGGITLGKPTRIVELPCAEWHMWQE